MRRRFTSRPAPATSALTAIVGVFMLVFALVFFSHARAGGGMFAAFMLVWVLGLLGIIIYHVVNAVRPGGVPTNIIESEDGTPPVKTTAERLKDLEGLRDSKLISEAEYERKRQDIIREV